MHTTVSSAITTYSNIEIDGKSAYSFEELNEKKFLIRFFNHLEALLGPKFKDYIFYIYANIDTKVVPDALTATNVKKKVLIYLSNQYYEINPALPGDFFAIFKCHLPQDVVKERIFHFPLGYVKDTVEQEVKEISTRNTKVFFSGNLNKKRVTLYKALANSSVPDIFYAPVIRLSKKIPKLLTRDFSGVFPSSYIHFTNGFKKGLNALEYSKVIYDSQIVFCPGGFLKNETYRHFESMRAGCVIISEKLPDTYLYKDSPIIQVNSWREGVEVAKFLLNDPAKLKQYHEATLNWWNTVCNEASTAQHVFNKLILLETKPAA